MTTLTDPIPEFKLGADRYARREPGAARESEIHSLDPETQEVVETFEALYAELSYAAATPAPATDPDDDLQIDLPDEAKPTAPAPRAVEARAPPQSAPVTLMQVPASMAGRVQVPTELPSFGGLPEPKCGEPAG